MYNLETTQTRLSIPVRLFYSITVNVLIHTELANLKSYWKIKLNVETNKKSHNSAYIIFLLDYFHVITHPVISPLHPVLGHRKVTVVIRPEAK